MVHLLRVTRLLRIGRKSKHHLPHLVRTATGEEGGIHPPPPECRRGAPPPQSPLLTRATASGPEVERPGTAGVGAIGSEATGPLPEWWWRDAHRLATFSVSVEPLSAPRILSRRVKAKREGEGLVSPSVTAMACSLADRTKLISGAPLRCASNKLRCSI
jgi:hypothetical protein